jgi:hypothetical protein
VQAHSPQLTYRRCVCSSPRFTGTLQQNLHVPYLVTLPYLCSGELEEPRSRAEERRGERNTCAALKGSQAAPPLAPSRARGFFASVSCFPGHTTQHGLPSDRRAFFFPNCLALNNPTSSSTAQYTNSPCTTSATSSPLPTAHGPRRLCYSPVQAVLSMSISGSRPLFR